LREISRTLIGLAVAFLIVGLIAGLVFYLIPRHFNSSRSEWEILEGETISLYYRKDEPPELSPDEILEELGECKRQVVGELGLNRARLPGNIRVYLHEDLSALKSSLVERKGSSGSDVPLAVMDLIAGNEYEPVLVRLLTLFAWGRPSSEFLRLGLQSYFSDEVVRPYVRMAGLGESLFPLEEVVILERTNSIPRSLGDKIYDSFDSPGAPAGMSLSTFSSLVRFSPDSTPYRYELEVGATAFLAYLLEEYGPDRLESLWKSDSLTAGIMDEFGVMPEKLGKEWREFVSIHSENSELLSFYRARALFSSGKFARALSRLNDFSSEGLLTKKNRFLRARISFYRGDWDEARELFFGMTSDNERVSSLGSPEAYLELLSYYEKGKKLKGGKLTFFADDATEDLRDLIEPAFQVLDRTHKLLPGLENRFDSLKVFLFPESGEVEDLWKKIDLPESVLVSPPGKIRYGLANTLVKGMSRTPTYSALLRRGLVHFLAKEAVFPAGERVLARESWRPLSGIQVSRDSNSVSATVGAAFVGYLLEKYGGRKFKTIWQLTTPLGGDNSLDSALREVLGIGLKELEMELKSFLRSYQQ